jgi:ATP-binding cassette subfamily B (MDR/TAP) protein 9
VVIFIIGINYFVKVRSFANEDGEMFSYSVKLKRMLNLKIKQNLVHTSYDWAVKIAELLMTVSMLSYGAYLVTTSQISSGDFISFVIFQLTLGQCLEGLTSVYTGKFQQLLLNFYKINKIYKS